jgi:ribosome-associated protein
VLLACNCCFLKLITFGPFKTTIYQQNFRHLAKRKTATETLHKLVIDAILDKKGKDVVSLDLRKIKDTASDYFIITHGDSNTQVKAIYDNILEQISKKGYSPYRTEGSKGAEWMIIDFVDVTVHVFYREKRDFYALEELWSDATVTRYNDGAVVK